MKKFILLIFFFTLFIFTVVYANSGPVTSSVYPQTELYIVDEQTDILIEKEKLVFDFSQPSEIYSSYPYLAGNVSATYTMVNPTSEKKSVKMAFPYIGNIIGTTDNISVRLNNEDLPYKQYLCGASERFLLSESDDNIRLKYDFENIVKSITDTEYIPKYFDMNDIGKLYTINVKSHITENEYINIGLEFTYDSNKTTVIESGFHGNYYSDTEVKANGVCYGEEAVMELYVLGEDIDFSLDAYLDWAMEEPTDLCTFEITTEEISIFEYLIPYFENEYADVEDDFMKKQIYNMCIQYLDEAMYYHSYFNKGYYLSPGTNYMSSLVYTVDFLPNSTSEINVTYPATCSWDISETSDPQYSFEYILSPAKEWAGFKNLYIEVIPPESAPYIVSSSIDFTKNEDGTYTSFLEDLPDYELTFTLYNHNNVYLLDKVGGFLNQPYSILRILIYLVPASVIIFIFIVSIKLIKKIRTHNNNRS